MISNVSTNFDAICKLFKFGKETSADINRQILLDMAARGEKRPPATSKLGQAFFNYISKGSSSYSVYFVNEIKKTAPDWLICPWKLAADIKKNKFIKMAKRGEPKPKSTTREGQNLQSYLVKDSNFRNTIKKYAPKWIPLTSEEIKKKNELEIENLARNKKPLPPVSTKIGRIISRYKRTNKKFMNRMKKLSPHWFVTKTDLANEKKKKILELSKIKNSRPPKYMYNYTRKSHCSFDPKLSRIVRKRKPEWFLSKCILIANENKRKLLEIAARGGKRPNQKNTKLGSALTTYTVKSSSCYDAKFDKQIRKIAPHWFAPNYLSYSDCRKEVIRCKIKSVEEYKKKRKRNWHSNPNKFYKKQWVNWYEFGINYDINN